MNIKELNKEIFDAALKGNLERIMILVDKGVVINSN